MRRKLEPNGIEKEEINLLKQDIKIDWWIPNPLAFMLSHCSVAFLRVFV